MDSTKTLALKMLNESDNWLKKNDYYYIESSFVPESYFTNYPQVNAIIRGILRLYPFPKRRPSVPKYTPQTIIALLKSKIISRDLNSCNYLLERILTLQSPKTKNFSLKQGIQISINSYENSSEDPTPLNTVWFGLCLLDDEMSIIDDGLKSELLISISNYLIDELGYIDHGALGIYFYYGPTLKKEIYNASAVISAFLIRVGEKYSIDRYTNFGIRGIKYICNVQNPDGSWFYAGSPLRKCIDCFHQSYILQALFSVMSNPKLDIDININKGVKYYESFFLEKAQLLIPHRYDKRFTPYNTWLLIKVEARDVAEAITFYCKCIPNKEKVEKLVNYLYLSFFNKEGYFYPEIFRYGKNFNPYGEFQGWVNYSLQLYLNTFYADYKRI